MKKILFCLAAFALPAQIAAAASLNDIQHIVVIVLENHSFDNMFGHFPGAEGLDAAKNAPPQVDLQGNPYKTLPPVMDTDHTDKRFPTDLPNQPFPIEKYIGNNDKTGDLTHRFLEEQQQIDGGKMDKFATISKAGGLVMGYYDASELGLWQYAQDYTLADHFFHAAFGGSFLNHMWQICACTPHYDHAPENLLKKGTVLADGSAVNTIFPANSPHPKWVVNMGDLLPPQDMPTIGDRLSDKKISWAWYSGGWAKAIKGAPPESFQFHHQPFAYFRRFDDDTAERREHLKDESDFLAALKSGALPAVSFYKPLGEFTMHPGYADVKSGDESIVKIIEAIKASPAWANTAIIITFDENGGYWDHVAPPKGDQWGPGARVPTIIMSPFAKKHFVDHTSYDSTSILALIEHRYDLKPLGTRDAQANDLTNAFDFGDGK